MAAPVEGSDPRVVLTRTWTVRTPATGEVRTRLVWLRLSDTGLDFAPPCTAAPVGSKVIGECKDCGVRVIEVPPDSPGLPPPPSVAEVVTLGRVRDPGIWATLGDFVVTPGGGGANVFGIRIAGSVMAAWTRGVRALLHEHDAAAGFACPIVTYHGGPAALRGRLAEPGGGLKEDVPQGSGHAGDPPMMGCGVYTGSYWKARRFAVWSGDYRVRAPPGVVVRTLAFVEKRRVKVHDTPHRDPVDNAYIRRFFRSNPKRSAELSQWVDHEATWRREHDAVYVPAATCPLVRNDEWAFRADHLAVCDTATPAPATSYDASDRGPDTAIL